jgi:hypothetical protein
MGRVRLEASEERYRSIVGDGEGGAVRIVGAYE